MTRSEGRETTAKKCRCGDRKPASIVRSPQPDGTERHVAFMAGYECERPRESPGSHGVHGLVMTFAVSGPRGAYEFELFTNWLPTAEERKDKAFELHEKGIAEQLDVWGAIVRFGPLPARIGEHALVPSHDGQRFVNDCSFHPGKSCFYGARYLGVEEYFSAFLKDPESLWSMLREGYDRLPEAPA